MTHHTPGPWRFTRDHTPGQYGINERIRDKHNSVICNLHVNAEANARLIAAAPDMLAALRDIAAATTGDDTETTLADIQGICARIISQAKGAG